MMETGTFLTGEVRNMIDTYFIPLKYESGPDAEQFHRFGIRGTPTFIFLDSEGNEIHRVVGFRSPDDFIKEMQKTLPRSLDTNPA
jgi:thioredoxin-related protein